MVVWYQLNLSTWHTYALFRFTWVHVCALGTVFKRGDQNIQVPNLAVNSCQTLYNTLTGVQQSI